MHKSKEVRNFLSVTDYIHSGLRGHLKGEQKGQAVSFCPLSGKRSAHCSAISWLKEKMKTRCNTFIPDVRIMMHDTNTKWWKEKYIHFQCCLVSSTWVVQADKTDRQKLCKSLSIAHPCQCWTYLGRK